MRIRVGQFVTWRGGFGAEAPLPTIIDTISLTTSDDPKGEDEANAVSEAELDSAKPRGVVVTLTNGHWAYGFQISERLCGEHVG